MVSNYEMGCQSERRDERWTDAMFLHPENLGTYRYTTCRATLLKYLRTYDVHLSSDRKSFEG